MMVPTPDEQTLIIGSQLHSARESMGLSLAAAAALNLSTETLTEWEEGGSEPTVDDLWQISDLYGRSVDYFLKAVAEAPLKSAFRVTNVRQLPDLAQRHRQVLVKFQELCRAQAELEDMLGVLEPPRIEKVHVSMAASELAEQQRSIFDLGIKPIRQLRAILEGAGVKIFHLPVPESKFSGFSWWHQEYGPGALINGSDNAGRRNFTTAHELAHLLVDDRSVICDLLMDADDERYANVFAANFLMPADSLQAEFENLLRAKGALDDADFGRIAGDYGVSLEALGRRLEEIEMLPSGTTDRKVRLWEQQRSFSGRNTNPLWRRRLGNRFTAQALEAHTKGLISLGKFASLLDIDITIAADVTKSATG